MIRKILFGLFAGVCFLHLILCIVLYVVQRRLLYFPVPTNHHLSDKTFFLEPNNSDVKVEVITNRADTNYGEDAIIYFGGNSEDVSIQGSVFSKTHNKHTYYLLNNRGYAGSTGSMTEHAAFEDALALYDHVKKHHSNIVVIGRSLGTGVVTYLASKRPLASLGLVTPYDSITHIASDRQCALEIYASRSLKNPP